MMPVFLRALAPVAALAACAGPARVAAAVPAAAFEPAALIADEAIELPVPSRSVVPPPGKQILPMPRQVRPNSPPAATVDAANEAATREPGREAYVNAVQVYAWAQGALYRLYAAPERVSEIALQPGEGLVSVASGDTARWVIGDTTSGTGAERRTHVLVKPSAAGLRTNLVIMTDRRVYHVELESTDRTAMAGISWTYAEDELLALERAAAAAETLVAGGIAVEALSFGYRIEGDRPAWRPLRAFDDGSQLFIEFPESMAQGEAPPLFVLGAGGRGELVNYRQRGRYYVVDRLFEAAELRLGERRQQVVRIVREGEGRRRGRR